MNTLETSASMLIDFFNSPGRQTDWENASAACVEDMAIICQDWFAEHDPTPVDEEWLLAVGAVRQQEINEFGHYMDGYRLGEPLWFSFDGTCQMEVNDGTPIDNPTRGQVRTLCRVSEVTMKSESP